MKRIVLTFCVVLLSGISMLSQEAIVKGRVVDTNSSDPIQDVAIRIQSSDIGTLTDASGMFSITGSSLPQGEQVLLVSKDGYIAQKIQIIIQNGETVNLDPLLLVQDLTQIEAEIGIISLTDNELDQDEGTSFSISGLLQASRDVFLNAAAFDFSATFFRPRGLDNANGKVLINGIEMNKQFSGRPQWSNWGGLNDVQRNREFTMGMKANEYTFGDLAGTTNIVMRASQYRKGGRVSYAIGNRSYTGRVMGSYNSGLNKEGWAYSVLLARRYGNEGFIEGTSYNANSFFASVEKKLNDNHSLNFSAFWTPNRRGRSTAITEEVYRLKGRKYNPNWGYQEGDKRNSRIRDISEPVIMLNHFWSINEKTTLNTNLGYQFGGIGNSRIDSGGNRNPLGNYYQKLPSYFLRDPNPTPYDYQQAYLAQQEFVNNGQLNWESLYQGNANSSSGFAQFVLQEDRVDDTQLTFNSILATSLTDNIQLNAAVNYRRLKSENYAEIIDLLGDKKYLDIDYFSDENILSDLQNPNPLFGEGERYKYNYEINANILSTFIQAQFKSVKVDYFIAANFGQTSYQRTGLFENGYFPGNRSLGDSEKKTFSTYGFKGGATYKITGRHLLDLNAGYFTKAPNIRNSFANARQNNDFVEGLTQEKIQNIDLSYIYRSPIIKARLTGFYSKFTDGTDIGFFFTQNALGTDDNNAFVQEVVTNIDRRNIGIEMGIEAQITTTVKLKAATSVGQYIYTNNPLFYLSSDDFGNEGNDISTREIREVALKNLHVAGGPERAYQVGFEYRDPDFWWMGITTNYFSNAYIDVSNLRRTPDFYTDIDGQPYNDYDENIARELLRQEKFNDYMLVNIIGGKSWKIKKYFFGFFATINNVFNQEFITGGFEDSRRASYRQLIEEQNSPGGPQFGNRYFYGNGTTYYLNVYVRF